MGAILGALVGYLLLSSLTLCLGSVATRWLTLRGIRRDGPAHGRLRHGAASVGTVASSALVVAVGLFFVRQLAEFRDPIAPLTEDLSILLGSSWGARWKGAMVASVLATLGFAAARAGRSGGWWVASITVAGLAVFPALTGHAAGQEDLRGVAIALDALHVVAAGGWIGQLALIVLVERGWRLDRAGADPDSLLPDLIPAFSPIAMLCVGTLVATGVFATWQNLPGIGALITSPYGRLLSVKVLGATVVFALGAYNFRALTPRLSEPGGVRHMSRSATFEVIAAHAILFVTAILVRTSPSGH